MYWKAFIESNENVTEDHKSLQLKLYVNKAYYST